MQKNMRINKQDFTRSIKFGTGMNIYNLYEYMYLAPVENVPKQSLSFIAVSVYVDLSMARWCGDRELSLEIVD